MDKPLFLSLYDICLNIVSKSVSNPKILYPRVIPERIYDDLVKLKTDDNFRVSPPLDSQMYNNFTAKLVEYFNLIRVEQNREQRMQTFDDMFAFICQNIICVRYSSQLVETILDKLQQLVEQGFPKHKATCYYEIISSSYIN